MEDRADIGWTKGDRRDNDAGGQVCGYDTDRRKWMHLGELKGAWGKYAVDRTADSGYSGTDGAGIPVFSNFDGSEYRGS
jgi:hypothetical protein